MDQQATFKLTRLGAHWQNKIAEFLPTKDTNFKLVAELTQLEQLEHTCITAASARHGGPPGTTPWGACQLECTLNLTARLA